MSSAGVIIVRHENITLVSSFENQVTVKRNGTAVITSLRTPEISNSRYRLVVSILLALSIFTESLKSDAPTPYKRTHEYTTCHLLSFKVQKKCVSEAALPFETRPTSCRVIASVLTYRVMSFLMLLKSMLLQVCCLRFLL